MMRLVIGLVLSLGVSGCGLLEFKDRLLGAAVDQIPMSFEVAMGKQLLPSILPPDMEITDAKVVAELTALVQPVADKIKSPRIVVHISKDPAINAFAIPGGHLIFNKGMLLAAASAEEIVGVAAHEIAHAAERHSMRSLVQSLGLYAVALIIMGNVDQVYANLIQSGQLLLQNSFSRVQEDAADSKGFELLVAAQINPRGMIGFFERLESKSSTEGAIGNIFSTHPLTRDRIDAIEGRIAELNKQQSKFKTLPFDLKGFQARLATQKD